MDPYSTHLAALVDTAMNSTGPILELGCGHYSTPVLASICAAQERRFLVQASNEEWASQFMSEVDVELVNWADWTPPEGRWGMVFLDSEEAVKDRIKRLPTLAKIADVVVMHDANVAIKNPEWKQMITEYAAVSVYHRHVPWTAVLHPKK
jgi:hypothetical protein